MGIVEIVAGAGYLLQKIFLLIAEGDESPAGRRWRIGGWACYLIGLPMWMIVFYWEGNIILSFVEGGGAPAMILGLVVAFRGHNEKPKKLEGWLDAFADRTAFVGIGVSAGHLGGLVTPEQWLELGVAVGFLYGTYLLARKDRRGWLWYMLMNGSAGTLMYLQGYKFLTIQQAVSLAIVILAYRKVKRVASI